MKKYEGLFILNTAGREEGVKEAIDKVSKEITTAGGKIDAVQKMDKRPFSRVADKKHSSGFYANILFEAPPAAIAPLRAKLAMFEEVFRVSFTAASTAAPAKVA